MDKSYRKVKFEGKEYTLTQDAYATNHGTGGGVRYRASAVDTEGNEYRVTWETTEAWNEAQEEYKRTGEVSGYAEDEGNACDWDSPISVEAI